MRDPKQVLQQKEVELARVRKEVESLNAVVPLLADDDRTSPDDPGRSRDRSNKKPSASADDTVAAGTNGEATGDGAFSSAASGSSFLNALKRAM
jgi:hypothetical protein